MSAAVNFGDARLPDQFWDNVMPCPISGCWTWTGQVKHKAKDGGPVMFGRSVRRDVYTSLVGPIPIGRRLRQCPNSRCCNPEHIRPGTTTELALENRHRAKQHRAQKGRRDERASNWKRLYGITFAVVERARISQQNACSICRTEFVPGCPRSRACVDHCHETGAFRSVLCPRCNSAIGLLGDSPARLRAAAGYLVKHGKSEDS